MSIHQSEFVVNKHALLRHTPKMRGTTHGNWCELVFAVAIAIFLVQYVHGLLVQEFLFPLLLSYLDNPGGWLICVSFDFLL